ncbi:MAG: recombinase RecT [Sneathiella sp.]
MANQAVAIRKEMKTVASALEKMRPQMLQALPDHITADRMMRVLLGTIQKNPKLLECNRASLYSAISTCSVLGLEPDGIMGQAHLVPFKGVVQFIPGYQGLIALARNSGEVKSIMAEAVHENDHFFYQFGINDVLEHRPVDKERGEITHFYAIAKFNDGGHHWIVMSREDVEKIRNNSPAYKSNTTSSPWAAHFGEMGKKTAIRRLAKYLPMDTQKANSRNRDRTESAIAISDAADKGLHAQMDWDGNLQIEKPKEDVGTSDPDAPETKNALDEFSEDDKEEVEHDPETGEIDEEAEEESEEDVFPADRKAKPTTKKDEQAAYQKGTNTFEAGKPKDPPSDYPVSMRAAFFKGYQDAENASFEEA